MKKSLITMSALALCAALVSTQAVAEIPAALQNPSVKSGGVGERSRGVMEDSEKDYTFKAVFTGEKGIYLSHVVVSIKNKQGEELISRDTDGPMLLAQLPPGSYTMNAEAGGFERAQKFKISGKGLKTVTVRFPIRDEATDGVEDDTTNRDYNSNDNTWSGRKAAPADEAPQPYQPPMLSPGAEQ